MLILTFSGQDSRGKACLPAGRDSRIKVKKRITMKQLFLTTNSWSFYFLFVL